MIGVVLWAFIKFGKHIKDTISNLSKIYQLHGLAMRRISFEEQYRSWHEITTSISERPSLLLFQTCLFFWVLRCLSDFFVWLFVCLFVCLLICLFVCLQFRYNSNAHQTHCVLTYLFVCMLVRSIITFACLLYVFVVWLVCWFTILLSAMCTCCA